jgi:hypothetical protein
MAPSRFLMQDCKHLIGEAKTLQRNFEKQRRWTEELRFRKNLANEKGARLRPMPG